MFRRLIRLPSARGDHLWIMQSRAGDGFSTEARPEIGDDGRVRFVEVRIIADRYAATRRPGKRPVPLPDSEIAVTPDKLRAVALTAMLSWANEPTTKASIAQHLADFAHLLPPELDLVRDMDEFDAPRKPALRFKGADQLRKPSGFYERVGRAYLWLVNDEGDRRPAVTIADANSVPVTTVHGWIREARKRGFIGQGQAGKVGQ